MRTAIVIPNWNGEQYLADCIDSLLQQSAKSTIIVVDNGSVDESRKILESYEGKVVIILQDANYGFTGGVNPGIRYAIDHGFEAVALFNNDAVAEKDWLRSLIDTLAKRTDLGIVTGLLLHTDKKTLDSTGEQYSSWGLPFPRDRGLRRIDREADYIFGATGGASLYRISLFQDIGLFDQDFFAYYEDVDISFRAQLAGWKVMFTPLAIAYHIQGATSSRISGFTVYQTFKNLPWILIKNLPIGMFFSISIRFCAAYFLMFCKATATGDGLYALRGAAKSALLMPKKINERMSIQKKRRASNMYIKGLLWNDLPPKQGGLRRMRKILTGR